MPQKQVSALKDFISLFFPHVCLGCQKSLPKGLDFLCAQCLLDLPKTENHLVAIPGFEQKFTGLIAYEEVLVYLHFHKQGLVQKLLHALKYQDKQELGVYLGQLYGQELMEAGYANRYEAVVPVPLHPKKLKQRGFNQSEALAEGLANALGLECLPDAMHRLRANPTQTRKSRLERLENVDELFQVTDNQMIKGKRVLLVDDVLTTGATLLSCGHALHKAEPAALSFGLLASTK